MTLVLVIGVLFAAGFPMRTYLAQRASTRSAEGELDQLRRQESELDAERRRLETDAEIERRARADLGYVEPGEESYNILPAPAEPIGLPEVWPFTGVERVLNAG